MPSILYNNYNAEPIYDNGSKKDFKSLDELFGYLSLSPLPLSASKNSMGTLN